MALVSCKECGKEISAKAEVCPNCGAKPAAKTSRLTWMVGAMMALLFGIYINANNKAIVAPIKPPPTQEEIAANKKSDEEINAGIFALKKLRLNAKNPNSFSLDQFLIFPGGVTCIDYHAVNSFNAIVPGKAIYDPASKTLLSLDTHGNKFVKKYNETCTKKGGKDRTRGVELYSAAWK